MHIYISLYICICIHICLCIHIYICIYIYIYESVEPEQTVDQTCLVREKGVIVKKNKKKQKEVRIYKYMHNTV